MRAETRSVENPLEKVSSQEFQRRLGRVEELIAGLENSPDAKVREQTRELIQSLRDLHGRGLEQILEAAHETGEIRAQDAHRDTMLSSPIILYDYPKIAPESAGDLFDGTEIDEILSLRIQTMSDVEKR